MTNEIVLYKPNDQLSLEVKLENETVWLSQQQMVILFDSTKQNISLHINNIFKEGELNKEATVKEYLTVQTVGGGQGRGRKKGQQKVPRFFLFHSLTDSHIFVSCLNFASR